MTKHNYSINREETKTAQETTAYISTTHLDSTDHPYFARKNLVLGILVNIGVFLAFLLTPRLILLAAEEFDFAEFRIVPVPAGRGKPLILMERRLFALC